MTINKKILVALKSIEVWVLAFFLVIFVIIQAVYPLHSALQAVGLAVVILFIRVAFIVSGSKDGTQILE